MTLDPDSPLLHCAYLDDAVMHDGRPCIRNAFLFSTAVTGEPISVSVIYTPITDLKTQADQILGPIPDDDQPWINGTERGRW